MTTDETICLNSKVDGKQPYIEDRIYYGGGVALASPPPSQVTGAGYFMKNILMIRYPHGWNRGGMGERVLPYHNQLLMVSGTGKELAESESVRKAYLGG